jgi:glycolate oxidase
VSEFATLQEVYRAARRRLTLGVWDYLSGGTESETTLRRNRLAIDSIAFRPRVLVDVGDIDCSTTFLGRKMRLPLALAPIGSLQTIEPGGALSAALGAKAGGIMSILSSVTQPSLEEVAKAGNPTIFQLYVRGDAAWVDEYLKRAVDNGYIALTLTVDTAIYSRRERDLIKRYLPAGRREVGGRDWQAALAWDTAKRIKDKFDVPLILKGIATAEDAALCVKHGVDVVYVSNHGGRQLDHGRGAIEVLPEVVEAVKGKAKVIIDGGFLRGTDIIKAIALGADLVAIGKLQGWGLAAAGVEGVARVIELLEVEMRASMGLLGVTRLDQLNKAYLHLGAPPVHVPHAASAYPHVNVPTPEY